MNYLKYFQSPKYNRENYNCWDFVRQIFRNEHGLELPDLPIMTDTESISYLKSNIEYREITEPKAGCIVLFYCSGKGHAGYAINYKEFIHLTYKNPQITRIPKNVSLYEVLND